MKVVYTAIIGPYDDLKEPKILTPGWKYVCFTDQPYKSKIWEIRKVKTEVGKERLLSKYLKLAPHLSMQYDQSIWVDGSFIINCNLDQFWERFRSPLTFMQHPFRRCVYAEGKACIQNGRDHPNNILPMLARYRKLGIPMNNGMAATGIIMRAWNDHVNQFGEIWYEELASGSLRDQISWGFANFQLPISHRIKWDYRTATEFLHVPHLDKQQKRAARYAHYKKSNLI